MFAQLGRHPVCASCRVLRASRPACRSSVRAVASSTRVCYALPNKGTGATIAPPPFQGEACTYPPISPTPGASDTVSIGQRLYSLTQFCTKVCLGPKRDDAELERLATEAWNLLQSISEEEVEALPLRDVAEIVVAYNHFCGFWANGLNGPARAVRDGKSSGQVSTSSSQFGVDEQPQTYPIMERFDVASGNGETLLNKAVPQPLDGCEVPVRRASPLDEILEF
ncbi:hypothetical protein LdCL_300026300 [Leishmania donovani]|uniref:RNA-editing substrate-binding complex 7 protein domain-containing protein n=1 Tax=Leishmania donovani TaxID=5661 RepID=A0A3S7X3K2_LEIDO|nr:hypothetical protein LdCL_300026300 [Leishmania donovani]